MNDYYFGIKNIKFCSVRSKFIMRIILELIFFYFIFEIKNKDLLHNNDKNLCRLLGLFIIIIFMILRIIILYMSVSHKNKKISIIDEYL